MLFKVGEETANLQQAMDNVVMMYEEELDTVLTSTSKLIEPLMIIFI
jgi:type II secretory pathway component PulF